MTDRDDLDELLADARLLLEADLSARRPPLDVLDVLQRARELSADDQHGPEAVELSTRRAEFEFVPDLEPELDLALEPDPEFAELNADARLLLDGLLERRLSARRTRWRQWPRASAAAAAAIVLLGLAGAAFASKRWQALEAAAEAERVAAVAVAEFDRVDQAWLAESERAQFSARLAPTWIIPVAPVPPSSLAPLSVVVAEPEPASEPLALAPKLDTSERLALLDAEAYALLRAGQHEEAARRFRTIVKIGGSSEYAELAFGELFALARRDVGSRVGADELDELWPAYLKRFPRGRYADAARAGLCRRTPEQSKRECWTDYLLKHPRGAARSEALRETQDD